MRVAFGTTRFVILIGDKAVKISRFGILRFPSRVIRSIFNPKVIERKLQRYGISVHSKLNSIHTLLRAVFRAGIDANRQEHKLYSEHPELPLAKVHGMYLGGLVLIMERGEQANEKESQALRKQYAGTELDKPNHVCRFGDKFLFIDYGDAKAPENFGVDS